MTISRRDFLKGAAAAVGTVAVGVDLAAGGAHASRLVIDERERRKLYNELSELDKEYGKWLARAARERYDLIGQGVLNNAYSTYRRTDRRILRRMRRVNARAAQGVRRYQGMRR